MSTRSRQSNLNGLIDLFPSRIYDFLRASGINFINDVGEEVIRKIVLDILCGRNLRDSTEMLTRRRLNLINAATLKMFINGVNQDQNFTNSLSARVARGLRARKSKERRWLLEWLIGLTDKQFQNVLRDQPSLLSGYAEDYRRTLEETSKTCSEIYGNLQGNIGFDESSMIDVDWQFCSFLLSTIGAQTLTIRGSEKSTYGKLFERLVLGSVLTVLGFEHVSLERLTRFENVFWLSERGSRRESDATVLLGAGQGVRFDLGFIGRGNPEIALDKVSRFRREIEIGRRTWYTATIVIVDRIGERSRIERLARDVDAYMIQMSMSYWPLELARILNEETGFEHDLLTMPENRVEEYLRQQLENISMSEFI